MIKHAAARKKLTPKQRVLKKWPRAFVYKGHPTLSCIFGGSKGILATPCLSDWFPTIKAAWADAARRLSK